MVKNLGKGGEGIKSAKGSGGETIKNNYVTWRKRWKVEEGRNPAKKEEGQRGLSGTTQIKGSKRGKWGTVERRAIR